MIELIRIPLSSNSATNMHRWNDWKCAEFAMTTEFTLQLDESTLPGNEPLLLTYVWLYKTWQFRSRVIICKATKNRYRELILVFQETNNFCWLTYLFGHLMEHHQWPVITVSKLLPWKSSVEYYSLCHHHQHLVAKSISDDPHNTLSFLQLIKTKSMLSMVNYSC